MIIKFKIYENYEYLKFKNGDYVYIDRNINNCCGISGKFNYKNEELEPYSLIKTSNIKNFERLWDYQAESYNFIKNRFEWNYVIDKAIIRKLTLEEIEEYKTKKNAVKYNL